MQLDPIGKVIPIEEMYCTKVGPVKKDFRTLWGTIYKEMHEPFLTNQQKNLLQRVRTA